MGIYHKRCIFADEKNKRYDNVHAQQVIDKLNNTYGCDDDLTLKLVERRCPNLNRFLNAQEGNGRGVNDGDITNPEQASILIGNNGLFNGPAYSRKCGGKLKFKQNDKI